MFEDRKDGHLSRYRQRKSTSVDGSINECVAWGDEPCDVCGRKVGKFYLVHDGSPSKLGGHGPTAVALCGIHSDGVTRNWRGAGTRHVEMTADEFRDWWTVATVMQA